MRPPRPGMPEWPLPTFIPVHPPQHLPVPRPYTSPTPYPGAQPTPRPRPRPTPKPPTKPARPPKPVPVPFPTPTPVPGPSADPTPWQWPFGEPAHNPTQWPGDPFPPGDAFPDLMSPPTDDWGGVVPKPFNPTDPYTPPGYDPVPGTPPALDPLGFAEPQPYKADPCRCPKVKTKTRKPKKRRPREVCYRGTYTERALGLSKRKLEKVPCR